MGVAYDPPNGGLRTGDRGGTRGPGGGRLRRRLGGREPAPPGGRNRRGAGAGHATRRDRSRRPGPSDAPTVGRPPSSAHPPGLVSLSRPRNTVWDRVVDAGGWHRPPPAPLPDRRHGARAYPSTSSRLISTRSTQAFRNERPKAPTDPTATP